ncbi:Copia protein, partial [Mucuna pruriens]
MKIKREEPMKMLIDNKSVISLAKHFVAHGRSKHIETKFHFLRDQVSKGKLELKYCIKCHSKCVVLINNLIKSFNSIVLVVGEEPIITMVEWIRTYLMKMFSSLRENVSKYRGEVMLRD